MEILFGKGFELQPLKALYGLPMDLAKAFIFSSTSTLEITGSKSGRSLTARILGPCRDYSQVELAYTDALTIGVDAPGTFFLSPFFSKNQNADSCRFGRKS